MTFVITQGWVLIASPRLHSLPTDGLVYPQLPVEARLNKCNNQVVSVMRQVLGCQFTSARYKQLCCRRHRHAIGAVTYRHSFSDCYKSFTQWFSSPALSHCSCHQSLLLRSSGLSSDLCVRQKCLPAQWPRFACWTRYVRPLAPKSLDKLIIKMLKLVERQDFLITCNYSRG